MCETFSLPFLQKESMDLQKIRYVFFDLDGTLLPMDQDTFIDTYMRRLIAVMQPHGYEPRLLAQTVQNGIGAMVRNDGSKTNETVFWECMAAVYGDRSTQDRALLDEFYRTSFQEIQQICGYTPKAKEIVDALHKKGIGTVLATNPFFPAIATESRMRWAGLQPSDFLLHTTYEQYSYCKPNPLYYTDLLQRLGCEASECLMVGNDVEEDMMTREMGMEVFLITDHIVNKYNKDVSVYPNGSFEQLEIFLRQRGLID